MAYREHRRRADAAASELLTPSELQTATKMAACIPGWKALFSRCRPAQRRRNRRHRALDSETLELRQVMAGDLVISEFMASNDTGIRDQNQDRSDWIEVLNVSTANVNLGGWFLTDNKQDLGRWRFPELTLLPNQSLTVFASGKNRAVAGQELHTNFRLATDGEYLGLVRPDGRTVEFDYGTKFPPQIRDVSFGLPQSVRSGISITPAPSGRLLIPSVENGGSLLGTRWTNVDFEDSAWTPNVVAIGYEKDQGYETLLGTNVADSMYQKSRSAYLRFPFTLDHPELVSSFQLAMRYDDGYVAYINGQEVARRNAPAQLSWNSGATAAHRDRDAIIPEVANIVVSQFSNLLRSGPNVLAIHALNDDVASSDFLIIPEMKATTIDEIRTGDRQYFVKSTPTAPNGVGSTTAILSAEHSPNTPKIDEPLILRAQTISTAGTVSNATAYYRVMFGPEIAAPMFDDGAHGDLKAGDGQFAVTLPAGLGKPGEMIRYRILAGTSPTDSARAPLYQDPLNSEQYYGTIFADPSIQSRMPVIHLFLENPAAADIQPGTRGSVYHAGKFYDNVEVDPTGRTVGLAGPKKSHDLQFSSDHWFEFQVDGVSYRMNDFDIISDFWNREKIRVSMGYTTMTKVGTPAHLSIPVRVEMNGGFYATYFFVDGGNEKFLERAGAAPGGALYKMNLGFGLGQGMYKKQTRTYEDNSDLRDLFAGLALPAAERTKFLYENVNIPAMVNFLAGLVVMAHGDCCDKNLYIYRDTEGTGEWEAIPWDMDSAFGRGGVNEAQSLFVTAGGIFTGGDNKLFKSLLEDVPGFRDMYLRRVRTLLDDFIQTPGTPQAELKFERWVNEYIATIGPEAMMDFDKWGSWKTDPVTGRITYGKVGVPTWQEEITLLRDVYFPQRRVFIYDSLKQANGGKVLAPQTGVPQIRFGQIEANPASDNQDEEFIELINPLDSSVDISGWHLSGGIQHTFRPGTVIPAGGRMYVSPNVNAFRARKSGPSGGQNLIVQGNYQGHLSNYGTTITLSALDGTVVHQFTTPPFLSHTQQFLRVSEVMYNPRALPTDGRFDKEDFEFIELVNTSNSQTIDLSGVRISQGVLFQFPELPLGPGERIVVARNQDAIVHRYGNKVRIAGQYGGTIDDYSLGNGGETIAIDIGEGDLVQSFAYNDKWIPNTDGGGYSLTILDPLGSLDRWSLANGWRSSAIIDGSPGRTDATTNGDFDGNQILNAKDIDLFAVGMRAGDLRYDLNSDGKVNSADRDHLILSIFKTLYGDANLDAKFDSADLVQIYQAGLYEDSVPGNAGWAQGDWDCDGDFTTRDFVLAFQSSSYIGNGPKPAVIAAPKTVLSGMTSSTARFAAAIANLREATSVDAVLGEDEVLEDESKIRCFEPIGSQANGARRDDANWLFALSVDSIFHDLSELILHEDAANRHEPNLPELNP